MSTTYLLWRALGVICLVGAVLAMGDGNAVAGLVFAGYAALFGMLARREGR